MAAIDFVLYFIVTVILIKLHQITMQVIINKAMKEFREEVTKVMLYVNSLNAYSQALQDLKDKEMFEMINKKEK